MEIGAFLLSNPNVIGLGCVLVVAAVGVWLAPKEW